jgi:ribosomal protein L37E
MINRTYTACRECGDTHQNSRSSSICPTCGFKESQANEWNHHNQQEEEAEKKETSFEDIETIHEMKEWIREYLL